METAVAYLISVGITACGIWVVAGTIAAGSPLAWTLAGLATVTVGSLSLFEQLKPVSSTRFVAAGRNDPLPSHLNLMAFTPRPIVWKTVMFFAVTAVLLHAVWGPY